MNARVPSIGSMTQQYSASPASGPNSSPRMPCPGKASAIFSRIAASASRSAAVTGSKRPAFMVNGLLCTEMRQYDRAGAVGQLVRCGKKGLKFGICWWRAGLRRFALRRKGVKFAGGPELGQAQTVAKTHHCLRNAAQNPQ